MELTPKVFRDVQFREKLRGGYHPEDVDEFLEQAAVGLEELTERLRQATERAQRAEQVSAEASATDEALKKMLLMAQRTADQAVREAQEEADKARREARQEAEQAVREAHEEAERAVRRARDESERMMADARARANAVLADADERGRKAYEGALAESRANMEQAEASLRQAQSDVEALRGWVEVHKTHLLAVLHDAQALVENAGYLSDPPPAASPSAPAPSPSPVLATSAPLPSAPTVATDLAPPTPTPVVTDETVVSPDAAPAVVDRVSTPMADGDVNLTSDWDDRYLDDLNRAPLAGAATGPEVGQAEAPLTLTDPSPVDVDASAQVGADSTIAIDERALDSFFSERDLSEERSAGRFRRRH
jgi:dTMP kinase